MADTQKSPTGKAPTETPLSERFISNANLAFGINTFTEVLLAMSAKLLELGVSSAETAEETDRVNEPLQEALFEAQSIEAHNAARKPIFMRVLQLGRLLPPEEADGAFLVDRVQVRHLLRRWHDATLSGLAEKYQQHAELGDWYYDTEPNEMRHRLAVGQWQAERRFGDIFKGLGENDALFESYYTRHALSEYQSSPVKSQVASQTESFHSPEGVVENADADSLEQHSIQPTLGRTRALIQQARVLAQRVESLPVEDIVDLSGYRLDKDLGDHPEDFILTGNGPKLPVVRVNGAIRWWIPNLVYSRLCQLVKLRVLRYLVATHAPAEMEEDNFVVVCPYFTGWLPLEEWQKSPQDKRVEITNSGEFSAHVALELLVDTSVDDATFGYVLPNGTFLRNPSRHSFGPFYIGLAVNGQEEQWRGMYHAEVDAPPPQRRWNDYLNSIDECNASPLAVANLLRALAALTDDELVSCVRLPVPAS